MSDETTLLPCPICGGQPDFQHFNITPNVQGRIVCSCGIELRQGKNDTEDDMRIIWNTRSDYAVQAENERKVEQAIAATLGSDASAVRLAERLRSIADEMRSVGASSMTPHELLACYASDIDKVADSLMFAAKLGEKPRDKTEEWLLNACNQATHDYVAQLERERDELRQLVRDLIPFVCADDGIEGIEARMKALGIEVSDDER